MKTLVAILCLATSTTIAGAVESPSETEPWLQKRLNWFQDQKFGIMMHWGIYSQWGCIESWPLVEEDTWARPDDLPAWTERGKDLPRFQRDYNALAKTFNPTNFNPKAWAKVAKDAGMKYVVFTTKHHDGFSMFDTRQTDFRITAPDVMFHTDPRANVTREVFNAFREKDFGIGAYYSKSDWNSPFYWNTNWPARTRNPNYDTHVRPELWSNFVAFTHSQIKELMTGYGPVDILWLDGGQVRPPDQDIQMAKLAAMARRYQPQLIIVDRTVGGPYENYHTPEQEVPDKPLLYPWETCMCMAVQWSYKSNDTYKSTHQLIHLLVDIVGKGGNLLLNVGPQPDGQLPAPAVERLKEIGVWLGVNGIAIYGTRPIAPYKEGQVVFTQKGKTVYAIYLPPREGQGLPSQVLISGIKPKPGSKIRLLGFKQPIKWETFTNGTTAIYVPDEVVHSSSGLHAFTFSLKQ